MSAARETDPQLVVALDFGTRKEALDMARKVAGAAPWVKVGLELFAAAGPGVISELKAMNLKVFLDLKYFDIPNTVRGAVRSASALGVDMVTLHALGGADMAAAARVGRDEGVAAGGSAPILLAVTVLTSMGPGDLPVAEGDDPSALALRLARLARDARLDGVVCSGREVAAIKESCGREFLALTPGIRPAGSADDQRRVVTPARAVADGSNFLVVGRPITRAADPAYAAKDICAEMKASL